MAIRKFWTVRDGQVGTAHLNRNGKGVDFRPGDVRVRSKQFEIRPPKGVEIAELSFASTRVSEEIGPQRECLGPGTVRFRSWEVYALYYGEYRGVAFQSRGEWLRNEDDRTPEMIRAAEERRAQLKAEMSERERLEKEKVEKRRKMLETLSFKDVLAVGREDKILRRIHSSVGRRRLGVIFRLKEAFGVFSGTRKFKLLGLSDEELLGRLLEHEKEARAARKAAWLARH